MNFKFKIFTCLTVLTLTTSSLLWSADGNDGTWKMIGGACNSQSITMPAPVSPAKVEDVEIKIKGLDFDSNLTISVSFLGVSARCSIIDQGSIILTDRTAAIDSRERKCQTISGSPFICSKACNQAPKFDTAPYDLILSQNNFSLTTVLKKDVFCKMGQTQRLDFVRE